MGDLRCANLQLQADHDEEDQIDKNTMEIARADDEVYTNMQELSDELPDNTPRFVLLSYPLTLVRYQDGSGRVKGLLMLCTGLRSLVSAVCDDQLPSANVLK